MNRGPRDYGQLEPNTFISIASTPPLLHGGLENNSVFSRLMVRLESLDCFVLTRANSIINSYIPAAGPEFQSSKTFRHNTRHSQYTFGSRPVSAHLAIATRKEKRLYLVFIERTGRLASKNRPELPRVHFCKNSTHHCHALRRRARLPDPDTEFVHDLAGETHST